MSRPADSLFRRLARGYASDLDNERFVATVRNTVIVATVIGLMRRPDADFPGRFDKILWLVVLVAVPVLGAIAYGFYNLSLQEKPALSTYQKWDQMAAARIKREPETGKA